VQARRYLEHIRAKLPERRQMIDARLAVSDERDAAETLAAFRLLPEPAILVTVAMASERPSFGSSGSPRGLGPDDGVEDAQ
jgi:hypothetical protein